MIFNAHAPLILLLAIGIDALLGDPPWLWRRVPHPVVWIGGLIGWLDRSLNHDGAGDDSRRMAGVAALAILLGVAIAAGIALDWLTAILPAGRIVEAVIVAILLAQRSLYEHVLKVVDAFAAAGLPGARVTIAAIVGRDPGSLDEAGIARAAIETTAENFSDGVVAPALWYLVGGLPGLFAYKAINTADSMIGHLTPRHAAFGWAPARLDDWVNLVPARLAGLMIAVAAPLASGSPMIAFAAMRQSARLHRSPNAGWPEAAMAGALGIALAGPRSYGGTLIEDHWMNPDGRKDAAPKDITRALRLLLGACGLLAMLVAVTAIIAS